MSMGKKYVNVTVKHGFQTEGVQLEGNHRNRQSMSRYGLMKYDSNALVGLQPRCFGLFHGKMNSSFDLRGLLSATERVPAR